MQILGFFLVSIGTLFFLYSDLGLNAWGILHQGISLRTSLSLGQASQLFGLFLILICLCFKVIPGIGTILNMFFIGRFTDMIDNLTLFSTPDFVLHKFLMMITGILVMAYGMFFYLKEHLGAGPKDGLMILLHKLTNLDIGLVRIGMELTAVIIGFLLGGRFGIGTIASSLLLGPTLSAFCKWYKYKPKETPQENIIETYRKLRGWNN